MCLTRLVNKLMGKKVDPRDFLLNTDHEMDKIVYFTSGSLTASEHTKTISHKLGFIPLIFGVWSPNSDFNDPRTIPYNYLTQQNTINFIAQAKKDSIVVTYTNYSSPSSTSYYRIYAFEPSNSHAKIGTTSKFAKNFILNTDYNYCKLYKKGIINGDGSVAHNLGYIPQVLAWQESQVSPSDPTIIISPVEASAPSDPITNMPTQIRVTNSEITFQNIGKAHYRIYYDEA